MDFGGTYWQYSPSDLQLLPAKKRGRPKKTLSDFGEAKLFFSNTFGQPKEIEPLKIRREWVQFTRRKEDILSSPREMFNKINEIISGLKKQ